tara:strand:+ start:2029 stop:2274 length:246 start_codon:yes stop_codon:yes gene_type:complete
MNFENIFISLNCIKMQVQVYRVKPTKLLFCRLFLLLTCQSYNDSQEQKPDATSQSNSPVKALTSPDKSSGCNWNAKAKENV